jgi:spermidine synthase
MSRIEKIRLLQQLLKKVVDDFKKVVAYVETFVNGVAVYAVFQSPHSQGTLDMVNLEAWIKNRQGLPQERKPDVPSVIP